MSTRTEPRHTTWNVRICETLHGSADTVIVRRVNSAGWERSGLDASELVAKRYGLSLVHLTATPGQDLPLHCIDVL